MTINAANHTMRVGDGGVLEHLIQAIGVSSTHPRLFINNDCETIATLQARCGVADPSNPEYQSHQAEYLDVGTVADFYSLATISAGGLDGGNLSRTGVANAFYWLMTGTTSYFDKAKAALDQITGLGADDKEHYGIFGMAIVFDWLWNDLTPAERTSYATDIVNFCITSSFYSQYQTFDPYYNDRKYPSCIFGATGSAVYNEDSTNGLTLIERGITSYERFLIAQDEISPDGYIYPLGQSQYFGESIWQSTMRLLGGLKLSGVTGTDIDNLDESSISKIAYGEIYSLVKDEYAVLQNEIAVDPIAKPWEKLRGPDGGFYTAMLAKLYQSQEIGKITNYLQNSYNHDFLSETFTYLGSILFNNKTANAVGTTITDLPKTKMFDNTNMVYKSGWGGLTAEGTDVIFHFTAFDHVNGHTHYNKGHFDLWRGYDPLTFKTGDYTSSVNNPTTNAHYYYYTDSLASNCMLIRNPSEDSGVRPNDGGQLTASGEGGTIGMHGSTEWAVIGHTEPTGSTFTGSIERKAFGDDWFYSYYNYPSAYSSSKLTDISRIAARVGNTFFIVDRIDGVNASYTKKWLLHSIGQPTIEDAGSWNGGTALDGNGGTPLQTSSDAKQLSVSEGNSKLFIENLFPINTTINRVGGSADYRWYSYNESINFDNLDTNGTQYGNWRIEIESAENSIDDVYLTVLYPTSSVGSQPTITSLSGSNFVGCSVADTNTEIAIFSNDVTNTLETGYTFTVASANARRVLCGDLQSGTYSVTLDTVEQGPFTVTGGENCLYFTTASGGTGAIVVNRTGA